MVTVSYDRNAHSLSVKGHAGAGKTGQDLVCAAVSSLVLTLGANVAQLAADGKAENPVISLKAGDTEIACVPKENMASVATLIFDALCEGFIVLQSLYPEHIMFVVVES